MRQRRDGIHHHCNGNPWRMTYPSTFVSIPRWGIHLCCQYGRCTVVDRFVFPQRSATPWMQWRLRFCISSMWPIPNETCRLWRWWHSGCRIDWHMSPYVSLRQLQQKGLNGQCPWGMGRNNTSLWDFYWPVKYGKLKWNTKRQKGIADKQNVKDTHPKRGRQVAWSCFCNKCFLQFPGSELGGWGGEICCSCKGISWDFLYVLSTGDVLIWSTR